MKDIYPLIFKILPADQKNHWIGAILDAKGTVVYTLERPSRQELRDHIKSKGFPFKETR